MIYMNLKKDKYIIIELIPTRVKDGDVIEFSALKLEGLNLLDRFNYRLNKDKILIEDFKKIVDYDNSKFNYLESTKDILDTFEKWSDNLPLLIIDNEYTRNYLTGFKNQTESIFKYLDCEYHDQIIEELMEKYQIEPTNYIVDVLYECLIKYL